MIARFVDWGPTLILWTITLGLLVWAVLMTVADRRKLRAKKQAEQDQRDTLEEMWEPGPST